MRHFRLVHRHQKAFTIVELLIATTVLSVILILVTTMMISIGNLYYKGINQARTQDNTRSIIADIAQNLEYFSGTPTWKHSPNGLINAYCMGTTRYLYTIGQQIGTDSTHVLWRDDQGQTCPDLVNTFDSNIVSSNSGTELILPRSRLTNFCITGFGQPNCNPSSSPYAIAVSVAAGDDDLLCDGNTAGDCDLNTTSIGIAGWNGAISPVPNGQGLFNILCKGRAGNQFCATVNLTTTAVKRM